MTTDELRAAAEFVLRCAVKGTPSAVVATALLAGPRWHDTPPVPGLYVWLESSGRSHQILEVDDDMAVEVPFLRTNADVLCGRWFGPLPEDDHNG